MNFWAHKTSQWPADHCVRSITTGRWKSLDVCVVLEKGAFKGWTIWLSEKGETWFRKTMYQFLHKETCAHKNFRKIRGPTKYVYTGKKLCVHRPRMKVFINAHASTKLPPQTNTHTRTLKSKMVRSNLKTFCIANRNKNIPISSLRLWWPTIDEVQSEYW